MMDGFLLYGFQTTLILVVGLIGARCLARQPKLSYQLLLAVFAATSCLTVLFIAPGDPRWRLRSSEVSAFTAAPDSLRDNSSVQLLDESVALSRQSASGPSWGDPTQFLTQLEQVVSAPTRSSKVLQTIVAAWVGVTTLFWMAWMLIGNSQIIRLGRRSSVLDPMVAKRLQAHIAGTCVRVTSMQTSPFVTWMFPRKIFVSPEFENYTFEDQVAIIEHEKCHLRNYDTYARLLIDLSMLGMAWHPFSWLLRRQLIDAQELITDCQAAVQCGGIETYRKLLSRLLLRTDSQKNFHETFCVSLSQNRTIRRIKMMHHANLTSHWVQRTALACLAASLIAGIGSWRLQADEPLRIASRSKLEKLQADLFKKKTARPWDQLGASKGYAHLTRGTISMAALKYKTEIWRQLFRGSPMPEFIEAVKHFEDLSVNLAMQVKFTSPEAAQDGKNGSLTLGGDSFVADFEKPIKWNDMASAFRWEILGLDAQKTEFVKGLASIESDQIKIISERHSKQAETLTKESQHLQRLLWDMVGGGQFTVAMPNTLTPKMVEAAKNNPSTPAERLPLLQVLEGVSKIERFAVGVDCGEDVSQLQVRLAFTPRHGVKPRELWVELEDVAKKINDNPEFAKSDRTVLSSLCENWAAELQEKDGVAFVMATSTIKLQ